MRSPAAQPWFAVTATPLRSTSNPLALHKRQKTLIHKPNLTTGLRTSDGAVVNEHCGLFDVSNLGIHCLTRVQGCSGCKARLMVVSGIESTFFQDPFTIFRVCLGSGLWFSFSCRGYDTTKQTEWKSLMESQNLVFFLHEAFDPAFSLHKLIGRQFPVQSCRIPEDRA